MSTELVIFGMLTVGYRTGCTKLEKKPNVNKIYVGPKTIKGYVRLLWPVKTHFLPKEYIFEFFECFDNGK